tara:strand:- start:667 stop:1869 length:1203 start_codon:yes stop_codon:yes gene_type:complete
MQWIERHRPKKFESVKGQDEAMRKINQFLESFYLGKLTKTKKKALILHGPPGVGKTTIAYVLANETDSEIFELNASDLRNREKLREILRPAIEQKSLVKEKKVILIDEVDGISGYYDRGGVLEILSLIEQTPFPIIITANDVWSKKLSSLRRKTEIVQLKEIDYRTIKSVLIEILRKEGKFLDSDFLTEISVKAKGDLRAAINDIQKESSITHERGEEITDERNKERDVFNVLREIFKSKPTKKTLEVFDSLKMNLDEVMLWIEKNIPSEYQREELERAFDLLSKADLFRGRIYKRQYWRFLVYESIFLGFGISSSKNPQRFSGGFTSYKKPDRILKIWINNRSVERKKSISNKYAKSVHIGEKRAMREFSMVKSILKNPSIQKELRLTDEEVDYLENLG